MISSTTSCAIATCGPIREPIRAGPGGGNPTRRRRDRRIETFLGHDTCRPECRGGGQCRPRNRLGGRQRRWPLLSEGFAMALHRQMFGTVWTWAGTLRQRQTNIGRPYYLIRPELRQLIDDVQYWLASQTFDADEVAIRLHHRMVQIHPFANGNGRHTRLMADLLATQNGRPPFSWGGVELAQTAKSAGPTSLPCGRPTPMTYSRYWPSRAPESPARPAQISSGGSHSGQSTAWSSHSPSLTTRSSMVRPRTETPTATTVSGSPEISGCHQASPLPSARRR